jgi:hypothetical protein
VFAYDSHLYVFLATLAFSIPTALLTHWLHQKLSPLLDHLMEKSVFRILPQLRLS